MRTPAHLAGERFGCSRASALTPLLAHLFWGNREWSLRSQAPPPAFGATSLVRKSVTWQVDRVSLRRPHSQRGYATSTQANYVKAIYGMAKYYRRDPAQYKAEEVQAYLLHMVKDRHVSFSSMNQTACAARFLYETVLGHDRETFHIPMAKVPVTQPELLSREEIARMFAACTNPVYRMILQTIYATGLRVFEACALRVRDIDSAADRMCIRVENGKGAKTRYTLLSPSLLELLRAYVRKTKSRDWLFCARGANVH